MKGFDVIYAKCLLSKVVQNAYMVHGYPYGKLYYPGLAANARKCSIIWLSNLQMYKVENWRQKYRLVLADNA